MADENQKLDYDPKVNYDEATMAQQREIEQNIAEEQPLIGEKEPISNLMEEFKNDQVFLNKIEALQKKYTNMRRTRGDGNCFFRSFGFGYMELLLSDKEEYKRFREIAAQSKDDLVSLGFPQFTIEDFHDTFMEVVDEVGLPCSLEKLLEYFNNQSYSDYLVVYLRLIVSGHLQKEADRYVHFIEGGRTVKEFCNQEVEPISKESDHIHITALTEALGVPVRIEYMDRGQSLMTHDTPEGSTPKLTLLYRPGHFDLVMK